VWGFGPLLAACYTIHNTKGEGNGAWWSREAGTRRSYL
jgi:hypothetical protein